MTPSATTSATVGFQPATKSWSEPPGLLTYTPGYWSYLRVRLGSVSVCGGYRGKTLCGLTEANLKQDPVWIQLLGCGHEWGWESQPLSSCPIRIRHRGGRARSEAQRRGEAASGNRSHHPERAPDHPPGRGEDTGKSAVPLLAPDSLPRFLWLRCSSNRPRLRSTPRLRGISRRRWPRSAPTGRLSWWHTGDITSKQCVLDMWHWRAGWVVQSSSDWCSMIPTCYF